MGVIGFDLEQRTLEFSQQIKQYVLSLPRNVANLENGRQLIRSAGSVGANYIEANDALGQRDFLMRIRIARKEAKEARYWLELTDCASGQADIRENLINEATELIKILSAVLVRYNANKI